MGDVPGNKISSLQELYTEFRQPLFRYLLRLTGSTQEAEELLHETFYQAVLSVHRYQGRAKAGTWLYAIARNGYLQRVAAHCSQQGFLQG
jgi:RNA polymerase sigma-70 factor (ECF subfamily)